MKILITGSTGRVGSEVLKEVLKRGATVRVMVRKPDPSKPFPKGVEVVVGDLLDPVSVEKALDGVDKLYLLNAVVPDELTQGLIAFGLAKKLGIKHIVYHSVFKAESFKDVPHFAVKLTIESALKEFNVPYTIIRPSYFFQNDERLQQPLMEAGIYTMPLGTTGIATVDVRDIAEATAIVLTEDGHIGKSYNLNGADVLSGVKAASIWSNQLKKNIQYLGEALDALETQLRQWGPSWSAYEIRLMFQAYLERGFIPEAGDVETLTKLLGHAPRSYESFANETAIKWAQHSGKS